MSDPPSGAVASGPQRPAVDLQWSGWLAVASLVLFAFTLLSLAPHSSDLDQLALTEQRGVAAWLFLAVLASTTSAVGGRRAVPARGRRMRVPVVWLPIAAAVAQAVALSTGSSTAHVVAPLVLDLALGLYVAVWLVQRKGSGAVTVAELGSFVAVVILAMTLMMEFALALADVSGAAPAAVLDARGPGLGAVAIVAGMALVEGGLRDEPRVLETDIAGTFQLLLFGTGWVVSVASFALDSLSLGVTSVGLHVLAVAVFLVRMAARIAPREAARPENRWSAAALVSTAAYLGLLMHVVVGVGDGRYADSASIPSWLEVAIDLTAFAGLAGNGLIWLAWRAAATTDRRLVLATFVLYNAGLVSVVVGAAAGVSAGSGAGWLAMSVACLVSAGAAASKVALGPGQSERPGLDSSVRSE